MPRSIARYASLLRLVLLAFHLLSLSPFAYAEDKHTFKIGLILSLTGAWSEFGEAQVQAIKLATQKKPELFSHIKFITEDCHYGGKEAVAAFNKLRAVDNVDVIFVWGVEPALAVAPLAEKNKVPLIVSAIVPSTAKGKKYVIRTINYADQHAQTMLKYLRTLGYKKFAIIKSQISFNDILAEGLRNNLEPDESLELIDDLLPTESDFKSVVAKAKRRDFDALGLLLTPSQILDFFKEASTQNFKAKFFGASPLQSRTLVKQSEGRMDGALFVHNDVSSEFESEYIKQFGNDIQIPWAANTYDFVMLAGSLLNNFSQKPAAEEILNLLSKAQVANGAGGSYHYVDSEAVGKYFEYPIVVKAIRGDEFQLVYKNSTFK